MPEQLEFLGLPAVICSPAMHLVLDRVRKLARIDSAVLVQGESGVGKEVAARALHHYSQRSQKPWVDVSCGALPEHLVESELFGYEKGAFSGAVGRKEGLFELANQGTLFLDEVGELDPRMQVKLLRVLDGGTYFRLGGTRQISVDVRVVAATNRNLTDEVERGKFRNDLYHRLAQLHVKVPPLRERREDILALAEFFMRRQGFPHRLSIEVQKALLAYAWPGNVRELRNVLVGACALCDDTDLHLENLPESIRGAYRAGHTADVVALAEATFDGADDGGGGGGLLEAAERRVILDVLARMNGHHERAAHALGISSRTLARKLRCYRLDSPVAAEGLS
ncbi:MAG: sigma-54-dependent Fis family transcriptional regulator [Bryobacterales bacterium]|nr:sigma-54-dependent Fis family transcriptional regulator [Bryobacterales bacterium]